MQRLGLDLGYGDGKGCYEENEGIVEFKFASAVAKVKESMVNFGEDDLTDAYLFNGKRYYVGDRAKDDARSTRDFNFLVNFGPLLAYHAIKLAGFDTSKPIQLIVGISIMNWPRKDDYIKALSKINVDNIVIEPHIKLMAQGQGVMIDYIDDEGPLDGLVCVADNGYYSFDFLVFENGTPRKDLCDATPNGANKAITDLKALIQKRFNISITEQTAKDIFLNKKITYFGTEYDFTDEINDLKEDYSEYIYDEMRTKYGDTLRKASKVIMSGGGAYFLENAELPGNVVFSKKPYEFANVRGYLKSETKKL